MFICSVNQPAQWVLGEQCRPRADGRTTTQGMSTHWRLETGGQLTRNDWLTDWLTDGRSVGRTAGGVRPDEEIRAAYVRRERKLTVHRPTHQWWIIGNSLSAIKHTPCSQRARLSQDRASCSKTQRFLTNGQEEEGVERIIGNYLSSRGIDHYTPADRLTAVVSRQLISAPFVRPSVRRFSRFWRSVGHVPRSWTDVRRGLLAGGRHAANTVIRLDRLLNVVNRWRHAVSALERRTTRKTRNSEARTGCSQLQHLQHHHHHHHQSDEINVV